MLVFPQKKRQARQNQSVEVTRARFDCVDRVSIGVGDGKRQGMA